MTESSLRVSLVQTNIVWEERQENLLLTARLLRRLQGKTDLAVLPETFSTGFTMNVEQVADSPTGETVAFLREQASRLGFALAGSFVAVDNGSYFNRGFFVTPDGTTSFYDKRHLFRMAKEDEAYTPGNSRLILSYKGWNICLQVCYDLRFPVWSRNVDKEYDLLLYVANWPQARALPWRSLLQARAIENMSYVCGVNRVGVDGNGIPYAGDSLLFDAKGKQLAKIGNQENRTRTVVLDKESLDRFRSRFPAWKDADRFHLEP